MDVYGVAVAAEPAQKSVGHGPVAEEVRPFVVHEIRCNDCGVAAIALLNELEKMLVCSDLTFK